MWFWSFRHLVSECADCFGNAYAVSQIIFPAAVIRCHLRAPLPFRLPRGGECGFGIFTKLKLHLIFRVENVVNVFLSLILSGCIARNGYCFCKRGFGFQSQLALLILSAA